MKKTTLLISGLILSLTLTACSSEAPEELKPVATIQQTDHLEAELAKLSEKLTELETSIQAFNTDYQAKQGDVQNWRDQMSERVESSSQFIDNLKKQVAALGGEPVPLETDDEFSDLFGGSEKSDDKDNDSSNEDAGDQQFDDLFGGSNATGEKKND